MPTQDKNPDAVSLLVGGKGHADWSSYRVDSDFLKASDAWNLQLGLPDKKFPAEVVRGAVVRLQIGGETVLSGRIDNVARIVSRENYSLSLTGRDDAGILVDCAARLFSADQLTLDEVIEKIVRPLGITQLRIQASNAPRNDKVCIEPGMRAWDALQKAAEGRGLWPWMDPDGTLVVGGPDYTSPPVATLVLKNDGVGNNVLSLNDNRSINGCFSELTVLAQSHAKASESDETATVPVYRWNAAGALVLSDDDDDSDTLGQTGQHKLKAVATDPSVNYYRPQIIRIGDTSNMAEINYRAKKAMSDARLTGLDISAEVKGHRTPDGVLWQPGQRVRIVSEPHDIDAIFFLIGRTFSGGRNGQITALRFKEDGVWIPDAFPRDRKRRRHRKKGGDEIAIVDVT